MEQRFETFTVLISKISRNIRRIKNQALSEYELRGPHLSCIYYLYLFDDLTAAELCERCEEDKATISRAIGFLEQNGYLTCTTQAHKRYRAPLILTEKGKEVGKKISEKVDGVLAETGTGLSEEERDAFYRSLAVISDTLEAIVNRSSN